MIKEYKIRDGTSWDARTSDEVIDVLEKARRNHTRVHLSSGYTEYHAANWEKAAGSLLMEEPLGAKELGRDWLEEYDTCGYIGRSGGSVKVPLLIRDKRSIGGLGLLDHCIVRIRRSCGGKVLWQHPNYHHGKITIHRKPIPLKWEGGVLLVEVRRDGAKHRSFKDMASALRYVKKLGLTAERVPQLIRGIGLDSV